MVDLYCERLGPGLWAEPINALTNLAFLIAAWFGWQLVPRGGRGTTGLALLTAIIASIGVGSGLFHTLATDWARILDVVPILVFQLWFLWLYTRMVVGTGALTSLLAVGALLAAALLGRQFPDLLNGSVTYLPALAVLAGLGIYHYVAWKQGRLALLGATGVFALSLVFRAVDQAACSFIPLGTHFLWHVLNSVVLYLAVRSLAANWRTVLRP